jgi:hypothetical protein
MAFNWKGYLPLIRIVGGRIRSCIGNWSLDFCHKSPSCSPDDPFLCDTMKNVTALCCSSPLCDGEIRIILTNLYIAQIPHCWGNISSVLHHSVIEDIRYKIVRHAVHCIMLAVYDEETYNCLTILLFMDCKSNAIFIVWEMSVSQTAFFIAEMKKKHFLTRYHNCLYAVMSWLNTLKFWSGEGKGNTEIMSFP